MNRERAQLRSVWWHMRRRCDDPDDPRYPKYGARGIRVCDRWRENFDAFLADVGPRPPGMWLERIDNDGNYEPGNCRWATPAEQQRNTRRNVRLTVGGETMTVTDWAIRLGCSKHVLHQRLRRGWSPDRVVGTPIGPYRTTAGGRP